ncbi:MAG: hypothetical protein HOL04_05095 [Gammaproteobacteria bacterium]|jgi:hypothetical protein|nr:hypothetical protein [Gammaproteobacteria bacterium]MBT4607281.1 hypothetical protein [Thiotrichales bacterium]MBT3473874.1 hypothetical protein [Gammaproteobacteria bacterium]MBT3892558.1 hypothetical protein [Gammaproteobacteria bacterium]MBT3966176.1 hypothetical protein [Gammaproteobacteria bacterium]
MMSQMRENLLDAIGTTYQQLSSAMERGEAVHARSALSKIKLLKEKLVSAREEEKNRYLHASNSEQSCLLCKDEDDHSVVVQAWNSCEGCEVTRFRSMEAAKQALQSGGYVSMSMI